LKQLRIFPEKLYHVGGAGPGKPSGIGKPREEIPLDAKGLWLATEEGVVIHAAGRAAVSGPEPGECIKLLRKYNPVCVAGNHDLGAVGKVELSYFNPAAAEVCQWTAEKLNPVDARYLEDLPKTVQKGDFLLVHGSPMEPILEYVMSTSVAEKNFSFFNSPFCLVGHTHVPMAFKQEDNACTSIALSPGIGLVMHGHRMIINPGAVGQPRDGDARAAFALFDSDEMTLTHHRVEYNITATQLKMSQAHLPPRLITRLSYGW
jgi:diadenosine tetraphosphatase ApaH/serine/threonine PP2A family protein phosphatase